MNNLPYWVEYEASAGYFKRFEETTRTLDGYRLDRYFPSKNSARAAAKEFLAVNPKFPFRLQIVEEGGLPGWRETTSAQARYVARQRYRERLERKFGVSRIHQFKEDNPVLLYDTPTEGAEMAPNDYATYPPADVTQPLHIPRQALIDRLNERLAEEQKKRQEAEDAAKQRRQSLLTAVGALSDDQIANLLHRFVGSDNENLTKWVQDVIDEKKYVSIEAEPTKVENSIEKTVRVLTLASDEQVEVKPTDPIYPLL